MSNTTVTTRRPPSHDNVELSPPARRMRKAWLPESAIQYGIWGIAVLVILGPIIPIAWSSLWSSPLYDSTGTWSVAHFRYLLTDPNWWRAVANSLKFAVATTAGSVVVGATLALLVTRTDMAFRRVYGVLLILPVMLPGLVLVVGWQTMWAPTGYASHLLASHTPFRVPFDLYSMTGMAITATVLGAPVVFLFARATLTSGSSVLEEAARCAGARPARALLSITFPLLRPALLNSGLLVFALSLETLGVPLLLGSSANIDLMSTYLYNHWTGQVQGGQGALPAAAILMLVAVTLLLFLRNRLAGDLGRFTTTGGKSSRPAVAVPLGWARWVISAVVGVVLICSTLVPLGGVVLSAFTGILSPFINPLTVLTTDNFTSILTNPLYTGAIRNSIVIASAGAALATICIVAIALVAHRSNFRFRGSLEHIVLYPRAVPGLITGMAFFWTFAVLDTSGSFRATLWALGIAFAVRALALGYNAFYPALASLGKDLDLAARTSGADWWTAMRTILIRLLVPAMSVSFILIFVAILNEAEAAVFLVTPDTQVLGLAMLQLAAGSVGGTVAALGVIQLVITAVVLGVGRLAFGARAHV
ncbi:ABC transporter permease [Rhodococcus wratislaviensis]|uniref:ABC transporter permease n=1 Tax=Rhodococcus wratislaviensis TaxID=44752 RepID=UPI003646CEBC